MKRGGEDAHYARFVIKSFKHDGSVHRIWLENWLVPDSRLHPEHRNERMWVCVNDHTLIREANGTEWVSRVPAVSFFVPGEWFNVVGLLEDSGIRYYCNIASPPYCYGQVLTYIDYDLDVMLMPDGASVELDRDEYERHCEEYRYGADVRNRIQEGLNRLKRRIDRRAAPFRDEAVLRYYAEWRRQRFSD
jgi:hypothetical protein